MVTRAGETELIRRLDEAVARHAGHVLADAVKAPLVPAVTGQSLLPAAR